MRYLMRLKISLVLVAIVCVGSRTIMFRKLIYLVSFILVLSLALASGAKAADPNLVGLWPLNEGAGDIAIDLSGNVNDGTISNADSGGLGLDGSVWVDDPERGTVISFNGTADSAFVRAGDIPQMTLTNDFTWSFWASHSEENTADNDIILGNRMDENAVDFVPRQFIKFTPTKFEWHMNGNGDDNLDYDDIPADIWLHHTVVKTGDQLTYYRNGVEASSGTFTQPLDFPQPLYFGGDNEASAGENWSGLMSDVRIYNRALTGLEILAITKGVEQIDMEIGFAMLPPVIDGEVDGIWAVASTQNFVPLDDPANGSGTWKVLYDAENLYVLVDMTDDVLQNDSSSSWQDDSVEVYFDGGNTKLDTPLSGDDHQYTFGWTTDEIQGTNADGYTEGIEHAQVDTDTGWRIEIKMPWLSIQGASSQAGDLVGIDCYYNDDDDGGDSRENKMLSFSAVEGWNDASQWATAVLAADKRGDVTAPGDVVKGVPDEARDGKVAGWPDGEYPGLAVDDDVSTKFLHFAGEVSPTGFVVEPASGPSVVTGLTLTTANDGFKRDPATFELSGSNDSIDGPYTLIAAGDIVDFAGADAWPRFTKNATPISFENDVAYKYYQVMFPTVRDPGSTDSMQIAEVELLGVTAGAETLTAAFAFGSRLLESPTFNDPAVNYTMVLHESPEAVQYGADRGYGYEVLYPTDSPYGDRSGYGVFGPFDDSPNGRNEFPDELPEELYDSFIGAKSFLDECSEAVMGDMVTPCEVPEGIIFRVDVPNGLYRFVAAVGEPDNPHAHRLLAEDGGSGPPENIGANHVVLVHNHDQNQFDISEIEGDELGDAVFARVGFDGMIPPPGDGVAPDPVFVDMDENGVATDAGANSPILEVTQGYIRIHQLQGNSNDGPGGANDANGGDIVILELWKVD